MKHIIKFGPNHYVHFDSYGMTPEEKAAAFVGNTLVFITSMCIAAITVGAMLGYDISTFKFDGSTQRVPVQHSTQVEFKR